MPTTAERVRIHSGPAILGYGFRPFFLFGAVWAAVVVAIWLPMLAGILALPTALSPLEWHVHELVYGYVPAIVAGFLLTAVPNWTGRLSVTGTPLLALVSVWAAGRIAVLLSARIGKSAVCAMLEAGCTDAMVRQVTGQSQEMVEFYSRLVNQEKLAAAAILKWDAPRTNDCQTACQIEPREHSNPYLAA